MSEHGETVFKELSNPLGTFCSRAGKRRATDESRAENTKQGLVIPGQGHLTFYASCLIKALD